MTGMGKTKLIHEIIMRKLSLNPHLNIYHVDTKKRGDFSSADGTFIMSEFAPDAFTTTGNRLVWQPLRDDRKQYDLFFHRILSAGLPAIVNIDECANMRFNGEIPRELELLLLQGRAAGIHVIGGTQQVAKSPRELRSQATFLVAFNLRNRYDKSTMIEDLGLDQKSLELRKYQFWFLNSDSDKEAQKFSRYQDFIQQVH